MVARLKERLDALLPPPPLPARAPTARELLHRLVEHADVELITSDGRVRMVLDLSIEDVDTLAIWEADAPEDDQIDEAAQ